MSDGKSDRFLVRFLNFGIVALLWFDLLSMLSTEWEVNQQYHFGYLVPFTAGYLLFLRWADRPEPELSARPFPSLLVLYLLVFLVIPVRIIFESNPDWRFVYWFHFSIIFGATIAVLWHWGGLRWVRHFALAAAMLVFAVPWPVQLERTLIVDLMRIVAAVTVESLNLLGIYAVQRGNVIELAQGLVGVEEACSGVRSFQSTLMSAFFLGELLRFNGWIRGALIALGALISLLLNVFRTLILTLVVYKQGSDTVTSIHDPVGYIVALTAFLILLGIAALIAKKRSGREKENPESIDREIPMRWIAWIPASSIVALYLFSIPAVALWYRNEDGYRMSPVIAAVDWNEADSNVVFQTLPAPVRAMLRCSEGTRAEWAVADRERWVVFFFVWHPGEVSSFIDVHRPELCLTGSGLTLRDQSPPFSWERDGLNLQITPYTFDFDEEPVYVYFAVWNDNQDEIVVPTVRTPKDRLLAALHGDIIKGRRSIEIVVAGIKSAQEARNKVVALLDRSMVVTR